MNINGSSSEWINVWTHFVLEYFITQYLKGFTAQYSTVGAQFLHDHDYLDISLLSSPSFGTISLEKCSIYKMPSIKCPLVFIDNFSARSGDYFDADCEFGKCQCEYW